jgi:hypothetical protein
MRELTFRDREELQDYIENEKNSMYEMIVSSIDTAYALNAEVANVVVFYVEDEDVYIDMISERDEWKSSLGLALNYYVESEMYEKCVKIKKLIDRL